MKNFVAKIVLILVLLLLITLGGCAAINKAEAALKSVTTAFEISSKTSKLTNFLTNNDMTDATRDKGDAYAGKLGAVTDLISRGPDNLTFGERFTSGPAGWFSDDKAYNRTLSKKKASADKAQLDFNLALSKDDLYRASVKDANDPGSNQDKSKKADYGVIIIIVVVILLIFLFLFLRNRANKPVVRAVSDSRRSSGNVELRDHSVHGKADKMNACRHLARKYGVDADAELEKCGGDVDALYLHLQRMRPLEDEEN